MVLRLNKHLLWEVGLEASCLQGLWPLCRQVWHLLSHTEEACLGVYHVGGGIGPAKGAW